MSKKLNVAVVGATGAVGSKMMEKLIERNFPIESIKFLASSNISSDIPKRLEISKAFDWPATPIDKWYVGDNVVESNSTEAFIILLLL